MTPKIKTYLSVCALLGAVISAHAQTQPAPLIAAEEHRHTISLDGPWHVIVDPYSTGYYTFHNEVRGDGYFQNAHPSDSPQSVVEYDFSKSPTLDVPGDWNSQRPDLFYYEGAVWYEKDFQYQPKPATRVFLYVAAANYLSRVYVNGQEVCQHEGGFTPFNCEITNLLLDGKNFAIISVDNTRHISGVPAVNDDWWNYGGLTRGVALVEVPRTFVGDYFLHLKRGSQDEIDGWVQMQPPVSPVPIRVRIPELNIDQTFTANVAGKATITLQAPGLVLWSPENPKLYSVEISSPTDSVADTIGFRSIEVRGADILLNGHPIYLRGISVQDEAPYHSGRIHSEEDARTLLSWAKDLGANYVRLAHFPHSEHMLRLADQMGLMVWSEVPAYWTIDWSNPATLANARQQLSEEIARDKNRASIIFWSVGNEQPVTDARVEFDRSLIDLARSLDNTRLITAAVQRRSEGDVRVIDDPLGAYLDVIGCNEYIGWYDDKFEDLDRITWKTPYDKPVLMSEFGADAKFGLHGDDTQFWTEEYQSNLYVHQFLMLDKIPFLRGISPWVLMDFRSPRRLLPGLEDNYNRKGLISDKGEKKKAFFTLQSYYAQKAKSPPQ